MTLLTEHFSAVLHTLHSIGKINKGLQSYSLVNSQSPKANEKIDCDVTEWKRTPCNATCGDGYRWKSRAIIVSFMTCCSTELNHPLSSFLPFSPFYKLPEIPAKRRTGVS